MRACALVSTLLDAFVALIEPLFARFSSPNRWVAVIEGDAIALHEVRKGDATLRTRLPRSGDLDASQSKVVGSARGSALELRLPPDQVLQRTLELPAAGKDYLEAIIEHRLERLTPWSPERVLYGFRVVGEPEADGSMAVAFSATSADIAAEPTRRLEDLGLAPTAMGAAGTALEAPLGMDLFRGKRGGARARLRRATAIALSAVAIVLAPALIASFWLAHSSEVRLLSAEDRLAKLRARLPAAGNSRAEQARNRDRALMDAKRPERSMMVLIDRLGSALPVDTFLRELDIDPIKIRLAGRSADAPALIGLLEAKQSLAKVQFAAPVTRDNENRDDFEIVATRPGAKPEAAR